MCHNMIGRCTGQVWTSRWLVASTPPHPKIHGRRKMSLRSLQNTSRINTEFLLDISHLCSPGLV